MIKVEVIENFTLKDFDKIKESIIRGANKNKEGFLYIKDIFECDEDMAKYLTGENPKKKVVVKILEVIPEEKKEPEIIATVKFHKEEKEPKVVIKKEEKLKKKKTSKKAKKTV